MQILPIKIRKLLPPKDDLFGAFDEALPALEDGDIVCIASKVVAIHQGRTMEVSGNEKAGLIRSEAEWTDDEKHPFLTIKDGQFIPFAGVDESNGNGHYVLWPEDPMRMAREIRGRLLESIGKNPSPGASRHPLPSRERGIPRLGVIITDSTCLPLRNGTVGTAIGFAGFTPIRDYRGKQDLFDRTMELSRVNVADGLAAAATLIMGEGDESTPVAIIRGAEGIVFTDADYSSDVRIEASEDIFAPILSAVVPSSPSLPTVPEDWAEERPFFTLVAVSSLDGIIAPEPGQAVDWASPQDQEWFHRVLPTFDATILGRTTYEALPEAKGDRKRVVLTSSLDGVEQKDGHTWFLNPAKADLMSFLAEHGWKNVGISGGGETYSFFLENGWADRIFVTVEPLVFGEGVRLFSGKAHARFRLVRTIRLNVQGTVLQQYDSQRP